MHPFPGGGGGGCTGPWAAQHLSLGAWGLHSTRPRYPPPWGGPGATSLLPSPVTGSWLPPPFYGRGEGGKIPNQVSSALLFCGCFSFPAPSPPKKTPNLPHLPVRFPALCVPQRAEALPSGAEPPFPGVAGKGGDKNPPQTP